MDFLFEALAVIRQEEPEAHPPAAPSDQRPEPATDRPYSPTRSHRRDDSSAPDDDDDDMIVTAPSTAEITPAKPVEQQPVAPTKASGGFFSSLLSMFACVGFDTVPEPEPQKDWNIAYDEIRHIRWLGSGAHGHVFLGYFQGQYVAVKRLKELDMTRKEMQHLHLFDHPNIIQVLGVCLDEPSYALVMEYCPETLYDIIHKQAREIPPRLVLDYARQIARGADYLHSKHIIHRDLKSPNVLMATNGALKITDFGTCREFQGKSMNMSFIGTVSWMAPEVIRNEPCSERVDIWSYGVVLWELLTCEVPYKGVDPAAVIWGVGSGGLKLPVPTTAPDGFRLLLQQCWHENPKHRTTFRQILIHLGILADDATFGILPERAYLATQKSWKLEVAASFLDMKNTVGSVPKSEEITESTTPSRIVRFSRISSQDFQSDASSPSQKTSMSQLSEMAERLASKEKELQLREQELARREERLKQNTPKKLVKDSIAVRSQALNSLIVKRKRRVSESSQASSTAQLQTTCVDDSGCADSTADTPADDLSTSTLAAMQPKKGEHSRTSSSISDLELQVLPSSSENE